MISFKSDIDDINWHRPRDTQSSCRFRKNRSLNEQHQKANMDDVFILTWWSDTREEAVLRRILSCRKSP